MLEPRRTFRKVPQFPFFFWFLGDPATPGVPGMTSPRPLTPAGPRERAAVPARRAQGSPGERADQELPLRRAHAHPGARDGRGGGNINEGHE